MISMNEYSPFLKLKNGELSALSNLTPEDRKYIFPLLEIPRDDKCTTEECLISKIDRNVKKIKKGIKDNFTFYIDNYEVPDNINIPGWIASVFNDTIDKNINMLKNLKNLHT